MTQLKHLVEKTRSKNAGPFWITIDIFCKQDGSFEDVSAFVKPETVAPLFKIEPDQVMKFELRELDVIKLSFPRPNCQGTREDRDMHGAAFACILDEMPCADI